MLLPHSIRPQNSIYYIGALVLRYLEDYSVIHVGELYVGIRKQHNFSFQLLVLALDWLFLMGVIDIQNNIVKKCS